MKKTPRTCGYCRHEKQGALEEPCVNCVRTGGVNTLWQGPLDECAACGSEEFIALDGALDGLEYCTQCNTVRRRP